MLLHVVKKIEGTRFRVLYYIIIIYTTHIHGVSKNIL